MDKTKKNLQMLSPHGPERRKDSLQQREKILGITTIDPGWYSYCASLLHPLYSSLILQ